MPVTVNIKAEMDSTLRRFSIPATASFEELKEALYESFSAELLGPFCVTYLDDEEDVCSIGSTEEFVEAARLASGRVLRVSISPTTAEIPAPAKPTPVPAEPTEAPAGARDALAAFLGHVVQGGAASVEPAWLNAQIEHCLEMYGGLEGVRSSDFCLDVIVNRLLADPAIAQVANQFECVPRPNETRHDGVCCDVCGEGNITGVRYKCAMCPDFDMCERCEGPGAHIDGHIFLKVYNPTRIPTGRLLPVFPARKQITSQPATPVAEPAGKAKVKKIVTQKKCAAAVARAENAVAAKRAAKAEAKARQVAEEEAQRLIVDEARRLAKEEDARCAAEEARRAAEEQEARRAAEVEACRAAVVARRAAEVEARRAAEVEARRAAEEEEARRAAKVEEARRAAEEEEARHAAEEEEARRAAEVEEARRAAEEEEARRVAEEQACSRQAKRVYLQSLKGKFVADATVPDGTEMLPGTQFTKIWRLENVGSAWPEGCKLEFLGGDPLEPVGDIAALAEVATGEEVEVAVDLCAPGQAGRYCGYWRMRTPNGVQFDPRLWVDIIVYDPEDAPQPSAPAEAVEAAVDPAEEQIPALVPEIECRDEVHAPPPPTPEEAAMADLFQMGFFDFDLNTDLLRQYDNNVQVIVSELIRRG